MVTDDPKNGKDFLLLKKLESPTKISAELRNNKVFKTTAMRTYRLMKLPKLLSNSVLLRATKSDQLKALSCLEKKNEYIRMMTETMTEKRNWNNT